MEAPTVLLVCRYVDNKLEIFKDPIVGMKMFEVGQSDDAINHCNGANMRRTLGAFTSVEKAKEHNEAVRNGTDTRWEVREFVLADNGLRIVT